MKSLTISPLRRVSASTLFSSSQSNEALPAMNESWLPRNVPLCSAGFHWSSSSLSKTIESGMPRPPIDFDITTMSGMIPARSNEKNVPVRQQPTWISSTIMRISFLSQNSRTSLRNWSLNGRIPPSAWSVSMITAAGLSTPEWSSSRSVCIYLITSSPSNI